jgi:hypothetical protein
VAELVGVYLLALVPLAVLVVAALRLGRWPAAAVALLFAPVLAASPLLALLALVPIVMAIALAVRLIGGQLRGDALPSIGWRDLAAGIGLGGLGFVVLSAVGAIAGLSIAFALWASRKPPVTAAAAEI